MFDVGFSELVLLFVIGLLILGPERLPRVASQIGRWVGRARRTANQLRHQLEREMALNEISKSTQWKPPKKSESTDTSSQASTEPDGSDDVGSPDASPGDAVPPERPSADPDAVSPDSKSA